MAAAPARNPRWSPEQERAAYDVDRRLWHVVRESKAGTTLPKELDALIDEFAAPFWVEKTVSEWRRHVGWQFWEDRWIGIHIERWRIGASQPVCVWIERPLGRIGFDWKGLGDDRWDRWVVFVRPDGRAYVLAPTAWDRTSAHHRTAYYDDRSASYVNMQYHRRTDPTALVLPDAELLSFPCSKDGSIQGSIEVPDRALALWVGAPAVDGIAERPSKRQCVHGEGL